MIGKRIISALTGMAMLAATATTCVGCSAKEFFNNEKDEKSDEAESNDGELSNGDWLKMVDTAFGMQVDPEAENGELDAAKEWGIIGEDEEIDLNAPVDDKFVTTTLTRAAGYATPESSDEEVIEAAINHGIITQSGESVATPEAAVQSLANAQDSWSHQTFENKYDIELQDGVKNMSDTLKVTDVVIGDNSVTLPSEYADSLEEDSVFIVPKEAGDGKGGAYKTVSVKKNDDGTSTVKSVPAKMEDVYKDVDVQGRFYADYNSFEPASDNVKVTNISYEPSSEGEIMQLGMCSEEPRMQQLMSVPGSIDFEAELGDGFKVAASLKDVALNADVDWDYGIFKGLTIDRIYMAVDYTTEVSVTKEFEKKLEGKDRFLKTGFLDSPSIEIGKLGVYICPGISVNLRVKLSLEASGKIEVKVSTENTKGFEMKNGSLRAINETTNSADILLSGEAGAYATLTLALSLDYIVGVLDLVSLNLKVGPTLKAEVAYHTTDKPDTDDMLCIEVGGYLKIEVKIQFMEQILEAFDLSASITLLDIDEQSSPIKWHKHFENFKEVPGDKCTWGEEPEEPTTEAATITVGIFALEKSYLSLEVGSSSKINVKSLPSGYTVDDVIWESTDPSKVTVDANGNVTAKAAGSVGINVKTKDGKYTASCAIVAKGTMPVQFSEPVMNTNSVAIAA